MKGNARTAQRSHVRARGGRRGTPQAAPRRSGPMLRGLIATVGIGALFLLIAAGAFLAPGQTAGSTGDTGGPAALFPTMPVATRTAGPPATSVPRGPQGDTGLPLIAIVAGHTGYNPAAPQDDPGSVCADGYTEAMLTQSIADRVVASLKEQGYRTVLLGEVDARLPGLRATAFLSIHADSCEYINDEATGFKVSGPKPPRAIPEQHQKLVDCLNDRYRADTGLGIHSQSISADMWNYHAFSEIDERTPAAIIEVGFMYMDRQILTEHQDVIAQGIVDGLMCFVRAR